MKIGILGGTFNPIHNGHLIIAREARKRFKLDKIIFMPCHTPYHKKNNALASPKHRLTMVKKAARGTLYFKTSDIEIKRGGLTYSIDTLKHLTKLYKPGTKFYFIIGSDSLIELPLWKGIKELAKLCNFIAVERPGVIMKRKLPSYLTPRIFHIKKPLSDISSSEIRKRIREKQSIKYLVSKPVEKYIINNNLYK
ncbi:MAG: nicotinate-nucleotide adenylyltransferase [Planctomycetes bacterium]|nr:nicotinate-nucleotide adenylyltransferase [Planctomycetota bacterium]